MSRTTIALATFHGARFLPAQLESLAAQSCGDFTILARDDGSFDDTRRALDAAARRDPRIEILEDDADRLGASGNYGRLLQAAFERGAERFFLCDQDDVWRPDKVARQLEALDAAEALHGRETPLLVHTDLEVVDRDLAVIHPSFLKYQGLRHEATDPLRTLCVQNFATGCTMLANRALVQRALPIPEEAVMHDWWLAIAAAATGKLLFLPEATVRYRQHGGNRLGAQSYRRFLRRLPARLAQWNWDWSPDFLATVRQVAALANRLSDRPESQRLLEEYLDIFAAPRSGWRRSGDVRRLGVRRQDAVRNALLHAKLWLAPRDLPDGVTRP
ncbi:MAG TPA: glycosyltransferase family 2 protein [Planctomycetia bacterium]|nr:glycosyltransferase family 2 protein [Planctomycetia bacterium]